MRYAFLILVIFSVCTYSQKCDSLYDNREFVLARECSEGMLSSVNTADDSAKFLVLSSLSSYLLEDYNKAAQTFDQLLTVKPDYVLDSMTIPPEIVALFEGRRQKVAVVPAKKSLLNYAPLGIGQIIQGKRRGWLYAAAAVAGLAVNAAAYNIRKSERLSDGTYSDANRAAQYYSVQQGAFYGLFLGTAIVSTIDAVLSDSGKQ
ncbi:MAG: hypothetical protein JNL74_00760 [Fibrobacteres bacterium]|nr:hypothetical protein [Fibrobacterota bacterium]